jgi:hypothetical protein
MGIVFLTSHSSQDASSREKCGCRSEYREVVRSGGLGRDLLPIVRWGAGYMVRFVQARMVIESCALSTPPIEGAAVQSARTEVSVRISTSQFKKRRSSGIGIVIWTYWVTFE